MNVSNQIKKFRERDGYSQEFLAEKMFVSRQTISNWENDKSYPDIHNLLIMCQLFKVSLDELVEDDNSNGIRKCSHRSYDSLLSLVRNGNNIFSIFNRYHCFYKIRKN